MILTVTINPCLDRTVGLPGPLVPGRVHRLTGVCTVAAGKGVNISGVLTLAGADTLAAVPAGPGDPLVTGLEVLGVPHLAVPIASPVRTNLTVTDPHGVTTKLNEPGAQLGPAALGDFEEAVLEACRRRGGGQGGAGGARPSGESAGPGDWVVLTGSLPPGVPPDWYARMVRWIRSELGDQAPRIAVDTSDAPLWALMAGFPESAPDLIAPNSVELAQLCVGRPAGGAARRGTTARRTASGDRAPDDDAERLAHQMESWAAEGNPAAAIGAARVLIDEGVAQVLVTLGAAGAVLVSRDAARHGIADPVTVRSTVGAGDCCLAGFLLAHSRGADDTEALAAGVAYGSAAVSMSGTGWPAPEQAASIPVRISLTTRGSAAGGNPDAPARH
ncbi:6-phosphofructokinase isozyme 2 [Acidipropionibacterium jensenii]|uniref:6-phosphofructokinase isozyme 2 n=1 Tax=Acidipropionibacterium jensenii TaxID=1749 RepID=A0A448NYT8_9ACTN|nr:1-phosphofructokinase family hexose kinase [Acidipropionibacterium jensenii]VEI03107.1 6-phosphofructokinase isozyme 2 [Acidipropionibacterium jensenii]